MNHVYCARVQGRSEGRSANHKGRRCFRSDDRQEVRKPLIGLNRADYAVVGWFQELRFRPDAVVALEDMSVAGSLVALVFVSAHQQRISQDSDIESEITIRQYALPLQLLLKRPIASIVNEHIGATGIVVASSESADGSRRSAYACGGGELHAKVRVGCG